MSHRQDADTRYFLDLDLKTGKIVKLDIGDRFALVQELTYPYHRVFLTKGQYRKLEKRLAVVSSR